jgi:hypothetical protein
MEEKRKGTGMGFRGPGDQSVHSVSTVSDKAISALSGVSGQLKSSDLINVNECQGTRSCL